MKKKTFLGFSVNDNSNESNKRINNLRDFFKQDNYVKSYRW